MHASGTDILPVGVCTSRQNLICVFPFFFFFFFSTGMLAFAVLLLAVAVLQLAAVLQLPAFLAG